MLAQFKQNGEIKIVSQAVYKKFKEMSEGQRNYLFKDFGEEVWLSFRAKFRRISRASNPAKGTLLEKFS